MMSDIEPQGEYDSKFTIFIKIGPRRIRPWVVVQLDRLELNSIHEVPGRGKIKGGVKIQNVPKTKKPRYHK